LYQTPAVLPDNNRTFVVRILGEDQTHGCVHQATGIIIRDVVLTTWHGTADLIRSRAGARGAQLDSVRVLKPGWSCMRMLTMVDDRIYPLFLIAGSRDEDWLLFAKPNAAQVTSVSLATKMPVIDERVWNLRFMQKALTRSGFDNLLIVRDTQILSIDLQHKPPMARVSAGTIWGDSGSPYIDANGALLGYHFGNADANGQVMFYFVTTSLKNEIEQFNIANYASTMRLERPQEMTLKTTVNFTREGEAVVMELRNLKGDVLAKKKVPQESISLKDFAMAEADRFSLKGDDRELFVTMNSEIDDIPAGETAAALYASCKDKTCGKKTCKRCTAGSESMKMQRKVDDSQYVNNSEITTDSSNAYVAWDADIGFGVGGSTGATVSDGAVASVSGVAQTAASLMFIYKCLQCLASFQSAGAESIPMCNLCRANALRKPGSVDDVNQPCNVPGEAVHGSRAEELDSLGSGGTRQKDKRETQHREPYEQDHKVLAEAVPGGEPPKFCRNKDDCWSKDCKLVHPGDGPNRANFDKRRQMALQRFMAKQGFSGAAQPPNVKAPPQGAPTPAVKPQPPATQVPSTAVPARK